MRACTAAEPPTTGDLGGAARLRYPLTTVMVAHSPSAPPDDETASLRAEVARLSAQLRLVNAVLDSLPFGIFWKDLDLVYRGFNRHGLRSTGFKDVSECFGRTDHQMPWTHEQAESYMADDRQVLESREPKPNIIEAVRGASGRTAWVETTKAPLFDADGELIGVAGTFRDITEDKLAEQAALAEQRDALQAMATPLLPVADGVVVVPLIGDLDPARAEQVMQTLLDGVVKHRARVAILDITGLQTIDTAAAAGLLRAARAIRLLGAEAIVTGVRAGVAQTLVDLGTDLGGIVVLGDLKAGIAHAIAGRPTH